MNKEYADYEELSPEVSQSTSLQRVSEIPVTESEEVLPETKQESEIIIDISYFIDPDGNPCQSDSDSDKGKDGEKGEKSDSDEASEASEGSEDEDGEEAQEEETDEEPGEAGDSNQTGEGTVGEDDDKEGKHNGVSGVYDIEERESNFIYVDRKQRFN